MSNKSKGNIRQLQGRAKKQMQNKRRQDLTAEKQRRINESMANFEKMQAEAKQENILRVSKALFAVCTRYEKLAFKKYALNEETFSLFYNFVTDSEDYKDWTTRLDIINNFVAQLDETIVMPTTSEIVQECLHRISVMEKQGYNGKTSTIAFGVRNQAPGNNEEE